MEEQKETVAATNQKPQESTLCEECNLNPSKYKCPGCSLRSCSLPCVKAHKQRIGCTGKRQRTQFAPLSQFDDNLILSDFTLLEEVKRVSESAQKMRVKLCGYPHFKLPFHLRSLRSAAASRRTKLLFLPKGMSRREKNQSLYNQRKKFISWTVEWRFHSAEVVLLDHGINEHTTLCSVIQNHLKPTPWNHQLREFCEEKLEYLKFFIRKYPKGPKSPFIELDMKAPLSQQLANVVILEYPVIHVLLPSSSYDFEVIKNVNPSSHRPELKECASIFQHSPTGVSFKEEEIEEHGGCSDPQVFNLMDYVKPNLESQIPIQSGKTDKKSEHSLAEQLWPGVQGSKTVLNNNRWTCLAEANNVQSRLKTKVPGLFEDLDFVFEQGLIDAYSDLIAEVNPDGFLDLDGGDVKEVEVEERLDYLDFSGDFPVEEELEEGEIPGF